jgi:hypothetical protein
MRVCWRRDLGDSDQEFRSLAFYLTTVPFFVAGPLTCIMLIFTWLKLKLGGMQRALNARREMLKLSFTCVAAFAMFWGSVACG